MIQIRRCTKLCGIFSNRQVFHYATDMTALGATDVSQKTKKLNFKCGGFQDDEIQTPWNIVKKTGWVMFA